MQNEIAYSRPVTLINILRFAVPTIAMSVFMSFYTMVDGLFVSNLIGTGWRHRPRSWRQSSCPPSCS